MKEYKIDCKKREKAETQMGCIFCDDGIFSEMILDIRNYQMKTRPIKNIEYKFYGGDISSLKDMVALVDDEWVQYFDENASVFCGYDRKEPVSFCIINSNADCILETYNKRIGSIIPDIPRFKMYSILNYPNKFFGQRFSPKIYTHKKNCVSCGKCVINCTMQCIRRDDKGYPLFDNEKCIHCYRCIHHCPKKALSLSKKRSPKKTLYY